MSESEAVLHGIAVLDIQEGKWAMWQVSASVIVWTRPGVGPVEVTRIDKGQPLVILAGIGLVWVALAALMAAYPENRPGRRLIAAAMSMSACAFESRWQGPSRPA